MRSTFVAFAFLACLCHARRVVTKHNDLPNKMRQGLMTHEYVTPTSRVSGPSREGRRNGRVGMKNQLGLLALLVLLLEKHYAGTSNSAKLEFARPLGPHGTVNYRSKDRGRRPMTSLMAKTSTLNTEPSMREADAEGHDKVVSANSKDDVSSGGMPRPTSDSEASIGSAISSPVDRPYPKGVYDPNAARSYFNLHPFDVITRSSEILAQSLIFGVGVVSDYASGEMESKSEQRAFELAKLLPELGPTFTKLGQTASTRSDLLPRVYLQALASLQDQVPAFANRDAFAIIASEFKGKSPFARVSDEPIAAASLGQVYRGTLHDGTEVAIKVQRPNVERSIALDMLLVRDVAAPLATALGVPGDLQGTADEWGAGLVGELDYAGEVANAVRFNSDIAQSGLAGQVFAPDVVRDACTDRVLTTVWVDGERLDCCSDPEDVPRLCSVAMNIYMEMLLDTGVLHCDPHPGNLLRTANGSLCILDWGLVVQISQERQLALIEHVVHITTKDYAKIPSDFLKLGFVPQGSEQAVIEAGVVDFLTEVYSTWKSGGGATKFNVPELFAEIRALAADAEGGLFQIPPYFAYIAKAFSVLEGIGLSLDADYSIVDETLPYISKRLLTDPSTRTARALETFLFGDARDDVQTRVVDVKRVQTLMTSVQKYFKAMSRTGNENVNASSTSAGNASGRPSASRLNVAGVDVETAADTILDMLMAQDDLPVREILLEQLALIIGASSRQMFGDIRGLAETVADSAVLDAVVDPFELLRGSRLVEPDERDRRILAAASKLASITSDMLTSGDLQVSQLSAAELQNLGEMLIKKIWSRRAAVPMLSTRLTTKLMRQASERLGPATAKKKKRRHAAKKTSQQANERRGK